MMSNLEEENVMAELKGEQNEVICSRPLPGSRRLTANICLRRKADQEGYTAVAKLFRAAARQKRSTPCASAGPRGIHTRWIICTKPWVARPRVYRHVSEMIENAGRWVRLRTAQFPLRQCRRKGPRRLYKKALTTSGRTPLSSIMCARFCATP